MSSPTEHLRRGQIWTVELGPPLANEQRGVRPCLVVSNHRFSSLPIHQAIVIPLTSRERHLRHHIPVTDDGGLQRTSWAMCEAVRAVSTLRLGRLISTASESTVVAVGSQIALWLSES